MRGRTTPQRLCYRTRSPTLGGVYKLVERFVHGKPENALPLNNAVLYMKTASPPIIGIFKRKVSPRQQTGHEKQRTRHARNLSRSNLADSKCLRT